MLKSLFWIGATGVALVVGIALHHGDEISEAGHQIASNAEIFGEVGDHFGREMREAKSEVDAGADPEEAYEQAVGQALAQAGILTSDNIDDIDADGVQVIRINRENVRIEIRDVLEQAREEIREARARGEVIEVRRRVEGRDIEDVLDGLSELEDLPVTINTN